MYAIAVRLANSVHFISLVPQRPGRFAKDCFSSLPAYGQQGNHTQQNHRNQEEPGFPVGAERIIAQPAVHDPPGERKSYHYRNADQDKELTSQFIEQLYFGGT